MSLVEFQDVWKIYQIGSVEVTALRGITLSLEEGEYCAITGASGSGKSTLLNLLGCLDRPTRGRCILADEDVSLLDDDSLSEVRSTKLGFIFQSYNLIAQLTLLENIEVPLFYQGVPRAERHRRASALAEQVGLGGRTGHRPMELSGGEQQRAAIARALANDPLIILADEPTGNLDTATRDQIMEVFDGLNREGKTIVMVTHEQEIARRATRVVKLADGRLVGGESDSQAGALKE